MDSIKIGKLIAKLRKEKDLTQQQLGDIMGVTDRSVSKWERGLSVPDVANINRLSTILGISSDELLAGELKENDIIEENIEVSNEDNNEEISEENIEEQPEETPDNNPKKSFATYVKFIIIPIIILISIISILILNNNKTYVYDMVSTDPSYTVDGKIIFEKGKISIIVNKLIFSDKNFISTVIRNYEYDIKTNDEFLFRFGYIDGVSNIEHPKTISEFTQEFNVNNTFEIKLKRDDIINKDIIITFRFLTENDKEITKIINTKLALSTE